ncbi:hypothetical protein D9M68_767660 [compost metagenome]
MPCAKASAMAWLRVSALPRGTIVPASPSSSATPAASVATTGQPQASASPRASGMPSTSDDRTNRSAAFSRAGMSRRFPAKVMSLATSYSRMIASNAPRIGPSPATSSRVSRWPGVCTMSANASISRDWAFSGTSRPILTTSLVSASSPSALRVAWRSAGSGRKRSVSMPLGMTTIRSGTTAPASIIACLALSLTCEFSAAQRSVRR